MIIKTKHFLLITGILTVMVSFLFFGRKHSVYDIVLLLGVVIFCVSFLWILVGNDSLKRKLFWIGIAVVGGVIHLMVEPLLIKTSYRIYLDQHEQKLAYINNTLKGKHGEITIDRDSVRTKETPINEQEKICLLKAREEVGAYMIYKDHNKIYYGLWGFLDVRIGITYSINGEKPDNIYRHITGNWYH